MPRLMAACYDWAMRRTEEACLSAWRAELLAMARGAVLEVGAGTGANLPHYPPGLERLVLSEPDPHMRRRLEARLPAAVEVSPAALEELSGPFDTVVSTLVLCSVRDLAAACQQLAALLRPGGQLLFLEHVGAEDDPGRARWQRRLEPIWRRIAGNCHLTRPTAQALEAVGFSLKDATRASMRKAVPWVRPTVRGVAVKGVN